MKLIQKAITATAFTFAGVLGGTMLDGNLTGAELVFAAGSALVVGGAVWRVPNRTP